MKINRLLEIIIILLNRDVITAKELASRFDVSVRTVYRDIEVLSSAGVPVYMCKGKGGGISLLDNFSLNKTLISEQDSENLLLALKALQATKYPDVEQILSKMGAIFKNVSNPDWVEIDFTHWGSAPNEKNKFTDIKKAILQHKVIHFAYVNVDGIRSSRYAQPQKLLFKGNSWYLAAYCRRRQSMRIFRISRMKDVIITNEGFNPGANPELSVEEQADFTKEIIHLVLRFNSKVLNRLYDDFHDEFVTPNDDGSFIVKVVFPEDEWVYGYILSFGNYVEVLEPEHIRRIISDRMRLALKFYN